MFSKIGSLAQKISGQVRLLKRDPERFGRNLSQYTQPGLFESRLIDIANPTPMHCDYRADLGNELRINVLDSNWSTRGMTGGPNTVINLVSRIARLGVRVRLVATSSAPEMESEWFRLHVERLIGGPFPQIDIVSAALPDKPLILGPKDIFFVTHWSTAQQLSSLLPDLPIKQFFYMLQEFEPGFYSWSSNYALAIETFGFDFWPIVNEALLADYLFTLPFGRLSDEITKKRAIIFEPAVDRSLFFPAPKKLRHRRKRLLFYARPTNSRNMFGVGLHALRKASSDPAFENWDFLSIGSRDGVPDLPLSNGHTLQRAPWLNYEGYAELLRDSDILLCPMLSPHTSYPVLEMAACNGVSVTNIFATKTASALRKISSNIVAVDPNIAAFSEGLKSAARQVNDAVCLQGGVEMASSWGDCLDPVALQVARIAREFTATV